MTEQQAQPTQEQAKTPQECCELYGEYCFPCKSEDSKEAREEAL